MLQNRNESSRRRSPGKGIARRTAVIHGRPTVIRAVTDLELDVPTPQYPPELPWVAELRRHWLAITPKQRLRVKQQLRSAAAPKTVEECLADIQQSLNLLDVDRVQVVAIIIALFQAMGGPEPAVAAKRIAGRILRILDSFTSKP